MARAGLIVSSALGLLLVLIVVVAANSEITIEAGVDRAANEVEDYRAENGRYPESLADLDFREAGSALTLLTTDDEFCVEGSRGEETAAFLSTLSDTASDADCESEGFLVLIAEEKAEKDAEIARVEAARVEAERVAAEAAAAAEAARVEAAKIEAERVAAEAAETARVAEKARLAAEEAAKPPEPVYFTMPLLVGVNLQLAQDVLQASGSYFLSQRDATGLMRLQVLDSNWKVCSQDQAPGASVDTATLIVLGVVKLDEGC